MDIESETAVPPALATVTGLPSLGLRALTDVPDARVRWVAVSELEDPTPFLEGGELVLTTGMRLTSGNAAAYVARLVARGVVGLGFGVGLTHGTVPAGLLEAARAQGLPLLEVPRATPFIAVGKAVSRMLAAERYEDVTRAFQAQRELTRAASKGPGPLVARLARELGGWALLLSPSGEVRHAEPAPARDRAAALLPELERLRKAPSSAAFSGPHDHVTVQSIGVSGRPAGFLAVGTPDPLPHPAHTIVGAAVALLTLQSETPRTDRDLRATLAALLLGLPHGPALPPAPLRVLACAGGTAVLDALHADPAGTRCLAVPLADACAVITPEPLADHVAALAADHGPVGVSPPAERAEPGGLRAALETAERALAAARRGRGVVRYEDLPGQGVLGLLDPGLARAFADTLLAPLRAEGLVPSLRAYITANGQGEAAARALGIHRHTLRTRVRRAAELLGRDLEDPAVRAELWIALAVTAGDDAAD
ncbi:PucR family transcriptional regulator [Actinomadura kijaniata]|uniref:PucR family transcriptional regulator n=1 Tax=Actinomadura kijaniata TaxID=46161 RepID=UPI002FE9762D